MHLNWFELDWTFYCKIIFNLYLSPQIPLQATNNVSPGSQAFVIKHSIAPCPVAESAIVIVFCVWKRYWMPTLISSIIWQKSGWRWPNSGWLIFWILFWAGRKKSWNKTWKSKNFCVIRLLNFTYEQLLELLVASRHYVKDRQSYWSYERKSYPINGIYFWVCYGSNNCQLLIGGVL